MEVGDLISNRYLLLSCIGTGPLTITYQARDTALDRMVTVKALRPELAAQREVAQQFQQEAQRMTDLSHPNLAVVYGAGADEGVLYRVTEYVSGGSLRERLDRTGALPWQEALDIAVAIAGAIEACHARGILHGNLTPQNVMFTPQGEVKVTDGGMDRVLAAMPMGGEAIPPGLAAYLSPEKVAGQTLTPASDVYAIGVVSYEMLAGRPPFRGSSPAETALLHLRQEVPPLEGQDLQLAAIVQRMLAKDPRGRYASAQQLRHVLLAYRRQRVDTDQRPAPVPSPATAVQDARAREPQAPKQPAMPAPDDSAIAPPEDLEEEGVDWPFILLGVLALLAVLGLIILWTMVYRRYAYAMLTP